MKVEKVVFSIATLLIFTFLLNPSIAQAGIFSFVADFISNKSSETYIRSEGASSMTLLAAKGSPIKELGGGDIAIVDQDSLLPESGPSGTTGNKSTSSGDQISVYVVRDGDSLSQIAQMFGVSVNTIVWANDLSGSNIRPGQTLAILPISGIKYKVKKGDTLRSIAKDHRGDLQEILDYNDLNVNSSIAIGDTVIVPDGESTHSHVESGSNSRMPALAARISKGVTAAVGYYIKPLTRSVRTQGIHGYNAVDLAAPVGTQVFASAPGTVVISRSSGWNGGYGKYVVVKHSNGSQSLYAHLSEVIVYSGARVVQGQVVGYVGNTGKSTGPHLHFEIRGAKNPF
jgi:murein DD-endopeptidase MepM/ murein hydrolase activator NlpD